jgi:uncharacterized phage protein (TIGR02220 family)
MVWVRIDDRYSEHPKIVEAGPLCAALWLAGLAYCNRNLTDGFIPWSSARTLVDWEYAEQDGRRITIDVGCGMGGETVTSDMVIARMVSVGLWHPVFGDTTKRIKGYQVHDYGDFQPSREQVLHERELTAKRVRVFKERHKDNAMGNGVSNGIGNAKVTGDPVPEPVPEPKNKKQIHCEAIASRHPSNGYKETAEKILEWLNEKSHRNYRPSPTNLDFIVNRLKDGIADWQLRAIVARKCRDWDTDEMRKYLRPATLFNKTKCEQYLGELPKEDRNGMS